MPIEFADECDYDKINSEDELVIENLIEAVKAKDEVTIANKTTGDKLTGKLTLSPRDREILLADGLLNYTKQQSS